MTERELRRLSRADLLELLLAQRRENEQLRCMLDQTQSQLADRTIKIDNAGTLAEASLQLSGIFTAAQDACQYYVDNIQQLSERQSLVCQQMEQETREKCDLMLEQARQMSRVYWEEYTEKCSRYMKSMEEVQRGADSQETSEPEILQPLVTDSLC